MLLSLSFKNFKSFREETTVSFLAGKSSKRVGNLLRGGQGSRVVKSMAFYGPNASGKTTVLDALFALGDFVRFSAQDQKPTEHIRFFESFALDKDVRTRPVELSVTVCLGGEHYTLFVAATTERVWRESLTILERPRKRRGTSIPRVLIDRVWEESSALYTTILDEQMSSALTRAAAIEQTTPNRLVLGKLASLNSDVARRVFEWFDRDLDFYDLHRNSPGEDEALATAAQLLKEDEVFAELISRFMRDADVGLQQVRVVEEKTFEAVYAEAERKFELVDRVRPAFSFQHATEDGSEVFFRHRRESSGTLRFVALLAAVLQPSKTRRVVCIDELSASLHPDLVRRLISIVHSRKYNTTGTQVLFTTHDTHLMKPNELLRRDQIVLCDKDRFGRSSLTRLDSFQDDARSDANLEKQYHQGRFGGKHQFGPTLEDVPYTDEPLKVQS